MLRSWLPVIAWPLETRRDKTTAAGTKAAISGPLRAELVAHGFVDADAVDRTVAENE